jgi:carboxymethylenebutenolidase
MPPSAHPGIIAETVGIVGADGDSIRGYLARPLDPGPHPAVLLLHHRPGLDEWYLNATRRFAARGYIALCPDLYSRDGEGDVDDVAALVNAAGGVADERVLADARAAIALIRSMPQAAGRIAVFGTCSGGRHALLVACRSDHVDAVVDCWGGRVVAGGDDITPQQPVAPVEMLETLRGPVLGIFGLDDSSPSPDEVDALESELVRLGRSYEFHRYVGAGHGFFYEDRPANYRAEQARDGWKKVDDFLRRTIG